MNERLRAEIAARAREIAQHVLERMYENPFWMERYGERGRRFADEDSLHHLEYLDQALAADDPLVFERYAHWLRSVLVSRGMCSRHLGENFERMADTVATRVPGNTTRAQEILGRGAAALRYHEGLAAQLEERRHGLIDAVLSAGTAGAMREDDGDYLVSYLVDAAATGRWDFFDAFAARFPRPVTEALMAAVTAAGIPPARLRARETASSERQ